MPSIEELVKQFYIQLNICDFFVIVLYEAIYYDLNQCTIKQLQVQKVEEEVAKINVDDDDKKEEHVAMRRPREQTKMTDDEINEGLRKLNMLKYDTCSNYMPVSFKFRGSD